MKKFDAERKIWARFREGLAANPQVVAELCAAMNVLQTEFNSSVRENRFIVGGAVERMMAIAMRAVGLAAARSRGLAQADEDIVVGSSTFSVKACFTPRKGAIRMLNSMGDASGRSWNVATLFVLACSGIGYADPELLAGATQSTKDAVILPWKALEAHFAAHPDCLLEAPIPAKPSDSFSSRAASESVVREILREQGGKHFPKLFQHM